MAIQKTWTDLLGMGAFNNTLADGKMIVRRTGADCYVRLWTFDTHEQATAALDAWREEQR